MNLVCQQCKKAKQASNDRIQKLVKKYFSIQELEKHYVCRDCRKGGGKVLETPKSIKEVKKVEPLKEVRTHGGLLCSSCGERVNNLKVLSIPNRGCMIACERCLANVKIGPKKVRKADKGSGEDSR